MEKLFDSHGVALYGDSWQRFYRQRVKQAPVKTEAHVKQAPVKVRRAKRVRVRVYVKRFGKRGRKLKDPAAQDLRLGHRAEYLAWYQAIARCTNPNSAGYGYYGGRGIKVCDRWLGSFAAFLEDVGPRPPGRTGKRATYSIDRFPDNNGNYEPGNVRWADHTMQMKNRRPWKKQVSPY